MNLVRASRDPPAALKLVAPSRPVQVADYNLSHALGDALGSITAAVDPCWLVGHRGGRGEEGGPAQPWPCSRPPASLPKGSLCPSCVPRTAPLPTHPHTRARTLSQFKPAHWTDAPAGARGDWRRGPHQGVGHLLACERWQGLRWGGAFLGARSSRWSLVACSAACAPSPSAPPSGHA